MNNPNRIKQNPYIRTCSIRLKVPFHKGGWSPKFKTGTLAGHCRHKMKYRRKARKQHETKATNIKNRVSIHERPEESDGKRLGDWEMDLIVDKDSNAVLVLVELSTNYCLMSKLRYGKKAGPIAKEV